LIATVQNLVAVTTPGASYLCVRELSPERFRRSCFEVIQCRMTGCMSNGEYHYVISKNSSWVWWL